MGVASLKPRPQGGGARTSRMAAELEREGPYFIGVDVGTGSVRAGLFTADGKKMKYSSSEIKKWTNAGFSEGSYEQSTTDIWKAVCFTVKDVSSGVDPRSVRGVGMDATCSLVAVDSKGDPVTVSPSKDPERNVILWQDHRAVAEAAEINATRHPVLGFVGGSISPEMEPPKLLWLKRHLLTECWERAAHFFDLADYLTFRATGATSRSLCCVVCKWCYVGHHPDPGSGLTHGWNASFWENIGLGELVQESYARIGTTVLQPGEPVGKGLNEQAAVEMGLNPGTPVATAIIDAHAGGLGMVGADLSGIVANCPLTSRLALIGGTSSCHMVTSDRPIFVPGVWGPYFSAMLPWRYLNEGGQSTTGQLLDYVLQSHSVLYHTLERRARDSNHSIYSELERTLRDFARQKSLPHLAFLSHDLHVIPDYHGNRSPLADPHIQGMICGLTMIDTVEDLAVLYLATVQALAYGTQHIIETMCGSGHHLSVILLCGGLRHNSLYIQQHADITGLPVLLTAEEELVLVGSAVLAAAASGDDLAEAMQRMTSVEAQSAVSPSLEASLKEYHSKKYRVFRNLYEDQKNYKTIMQ